MGEEVRELTAELGYERAQDLVGRYDLLEQVARADELDLAELITPLEEYLDLEPADLPVAEEELVEARAEAGLVARAADPDGAEAGLGRRSPRSRPRLCGGAAACGSSSRAPTDANDRVLGTELSGALARARIYDGAPEGSRRRARRARLQRRLGRRPGLRRLQRLRASSSGSRAAPRTASARRCSAAPSRSSRARTPSGERVNGSVGKSFAYGAQRGRLFVQGSADSRFCIRLSGADVVLGGEPAEPLDDARGCVVDRANAKGFAFEYMTSGRAVVLGDIGPWACAGMTGGRVYVRAEPRVEPRPRGDRARGSARAPRSSLVELDAEGMLDVEDLLGHYADELRATDQDEEAERMLALAAEAPEQLPDDRPGEGPGRPEHLDRVALESPSAVSRPAQVRAPVGLERVELLEDHRRQLLLGDPVGVEVEALELGVEADRDLAVRGRRSSAELLGAGTDHASQVRIGDIPRCVGQLRREHVEAEAADLELVAVGSGAHSTRSPLTNRPLRLRSSSARRSPLGEHDERVAARDGRRRRAARRRRRERPIRVQPGSSRMTA